MRRPHIPIPLLLGTATLFGVSSTIQAYWLARVSGDPQPTIVPLFVLNTVYWWVPALLAPFIIGLAVRYQVTRDRWPLTVLVHGAGALTYSFIHSACLFGTRIALMKAPPAGGWWQAARIEYLTQLDWVVMTYLFLVGLAHALAYRGESERRALAGARLETRLVEAQLQALQHQLHPHFLFNTLNAIAGLMRSDVDAADRMMDRLGDLLRVTLHTSHIQEVPLKDELAMLQKYLDIEQTRFGSRLSVDLTIAPDTLDAMVPNLLLQPLVENAVRHGIAPLPRPGRVTIDAAREGGQLTIRIKDSGDGVPPHRLALLNQGVGLANTRARLEHLYRQRHTLAFSNVDHGFLVVISIPFVRERRTPDPVRVGAA